MKDSIELIIFGVFLYVVFFISKHEELVENYFVRLFQ